MPQKGTATPVFSHSQTKRICAITFLLFIVACYPIPSRRNHYPSAAGTQAQLFAEIAFVQRNFTRAYELLSQSAKERGSTDQLREFIAKNHSSTYPLFVSATDYEPMPGQDKIMIYLYGENGDERFYYRMVLVGLAETGYKVEAFERSKQPLPQTTLRRPKAPGWPRNCGVIRTTRKNPHPLSSKYQRFPPVFFRNVVCTNGASVCPTHTNPIGETE